MIEVFRASDGWAWRFITEAGHTAYTSLRRFPSDQEANAHAKEVRKSFYRESRLIDEV